MTKSGTLSPTENGDNHPYAIQVDPPHTPPGIPVSSPRFDDVGTIKTGHWETTLWCGCFKHCVPNCSMVTFCPCVTHAQVSARLGMAPYWCSLITLFILVLLTGGTVHVILFVWIWKARALTRERFNIDGGCCRDCCASLFCPCCTLAQIATHIKSYKPGSCDFGPPDTLPPYERTLYGRRLALGAVGTGHYLVLQRLKCPVPSPALHAAKPSLRASDCVRSSRKCRLTAEPLLQTPTPPLAKIPSTMQDGVKFQFICFGFGQAIMLLNVASGVLSKYLTIENASLPTLQSTCLYVMLALVFLVVRFVRKTPLIGVPWWFYIILGAVDVEGNYFAVKAYNYANYATLSLILNMTVPFVTLFCFLFLKTRYSVRHYLGAVIALCGSIVIFVSDYTSSANGTSSREVRGDMYALIAAAFYATSNVMIQAVVKARNVDSNIECLGFLGFWAAIVSIIQVLILERSPIEAVDFNGRIYGYMTGYVCVLFVFYAITSVFLRWAESLMFNLSLLTGPIFTVAVSYLIFDEPVNNWYWLALALVYIGLICYSTAPAPEEKTKRDDKYPTGDFHEALTPDAMRYA